MKPHTPLARTCPQSAASCFGVPLQRLEQPRIQRIAPDLKKHDRNTSPLSAALRPYRLRSLLPGWTTSTRHIGDKARIGGSTGSFSKFLGQPRLFFPHRSSTRSRMFRIPAFQKAISVSGNGCPASKTHHKRLLPARPSVRELLQQVHRVRFPCRFIPRCKRPGRSTIALLPLAPRGHPVSQRRPTCPLRLANPSAHPCHFSLLALGSVAITAQPVCYAATPLPFA